jgi:hypothetical protein
VIPHPRLLTTGSPHRVVTEPILVTIVRALQRVRARYTTTVAAAAAAASALDVFRRGKQELELLRVALFLEVLLTESFSHDRALLYASSRVGNFGSMVDSASEKNEFFCLEKNQPVR